MENLLSVDLDTLPDFLFKWKLKLTLIYRNNLAFVRCLKLSIDVLKIENKTFPTEIKDVEE